MGSSCRDSGRGRPRATAGAAAKPRAFGLREPPTEPNPCPTRAQNSLTLSEPPIAQENLVADRVMFDDLEHREGATGKRAALGDGRQALSELDRRGHRQEDLIDEAGGEEGAVHSAAAKGEEKPAPEAPQLAKGGLRIELLLPGDEAAHAARLDKARGRRTGDE